MRISRIYYIDGALAKEKTPRRKGQILQQVVGLLPGRDVPNRSSEPLQIQYSDELANISDQPDVVADALLHNYNARCSQAEKANGDEKRKMLLSALKSFIECSKTISENLMVRQRIPEPSVNAYMYVGSVTDPEFIAIKAKHEAEVVRRAYVDQQNNMLEFLLLLGPTPFKLLKDELHLSDEEFAKIWMEVNARKFDGSTKGQ